MSQSTSGARVTPLLLAAVIVGSTATATAFVRHLPWLTTKVSDEHGAVWLLRPVVAPGDDVEIEVAAFGGRRAGIDSIDVTGPGTRFSVKGRGNDWGALLQTRASSRGEAFEFVKFKLSKDVAVGADVTFDVGVQSIHAESLGPGEFRNTGADAHYQMTVRPVAPATRTWIRVGAGALAALWLLVGTLVSARARRADRDDDESARGLGHARRTIGLAVYGVAAWLVFATAMQLATGLYGVFETVGFVLAAFLVPWLGAAGLRGAPPPAALTGRMLTTEAASGYRAPARSRTTETHPIIARAVANIARARLHSSDDRLRVEARSAFHRPPTSFVELAFSSEDGELARLRFNDSELLLDVSVAVARAVGAFTLELTRGRTYRYAIDERTSADDVVRAFRSAQREEIQRGRTDHRSLDDARSALLGVLSARSEHALRSERDRESEARAGVDHVLPGG